MTAERPALPWVLVRAKRPTIRFPTLAAAQAFYDSLRFNAWPKEDAAVYGPDGEAWYCRRWRSSYWTRGADRRSSQSEDAA